MRPTGNLKSSYNVGERVEYECRLGYSHRRPLPKFITCQENQQWSQISNDTCYKKSCPRQAEPANSQVNLVNGSYEYGNQIEFVCNEGYYLIGERILYCELSDSGMQWSGSPPRCERIVCAPPPAIPNGAHSGFGMEVFEYQAAVTYTCNRASGPDEFSLIGESQLYCVGSGKWSSDPPQCKVVKCPFPGLTNGRQLSGFGTKFYYKAKVMFACNQGFYLQGSEIVTCAENSTWQPPIPSCLQGQPPSNTKPPIVSSSAPKPPNGNPSVTPGERPPVSSQPPNVAPSASRPPNVTPSASQPPNLTPSASRPPNAAPSVPRPPNVTPSAPQPPNLAPSVWRPPKSRPSVSMPSGPAPSSARPRISSIFQYTCLREGPFDLRDILGWIVVLITTVLGLL
ncbi:membrane cofactor protein-like [Lepus europaeus]|uniref:membrane cofactor protein-like n=1 Tax=Lepus europaeus TaxID=9983 RepID=UPI002B486CC0|nr:membrane cofactor protein-like [Lepus europaeus]